MQGESDALQAHQGHALPGGETEGGCGVETGFFL